MPRVKILGTAITATHGTLSAGDIVNVSDQFAAHLVNDCKVAEYLDTPAPNAAPASEGKSSKPRKQKPEASPQEGSEEQMDEESGLTTETDSE